MEKAAPDATIDEPRLPGSSTTATGGAVGDRRFNGGRRRLGSLPRIVSSEIRLASEDWILPSWPAPPRVQAVSTTRIGGFSEPPYEGLNLADHVGDDPETVRSNRQWLKRTLGLPAEPVWLRQVHGARMVPAETAKADAKADGSFTFHAAVVCAVLTADCLPLLLCDRDGSRVAAAHVGWRGLKAGIIEAAVDALDKAGAELMAWLGPAIGPNAFEVGDEVRQTFIDHEQRAAAAFRPTPSGRWLADVFALARQRLASRGVEAVYGGDRCTLSEAQRFYSYRRDGTTGRMASLIWLNNASRC